MEKDFKEINRIEQLTQQYFTNGEIRLGLKTYRSLMEIYPNEKNYYANYINFLRDETVVAELLWSAYEEAVACCNRAILLFAKDEAEYFYIKKLELYILMVEGDFKWFQNHQTEIKQFLQTTFEKYPKDIIILKRIMALYRLSGDHAEEDYMLTILFQNEPNDPLIVLQKVTNLENNGKTDESITILENWIKNNPMSTYLNAAYPKIIALYKKAENQEMADVYQDLLDNQ
jgi:hypothetical protein